MSKGPVSEKQYLKSGRARKLPIHECWMPSDWEELGKFSMVVARKHSNGNITAAILLVDILCTGVKDAWWLFNTPEFEYRDIVERYATVQDMQRFDYNFVHNVIYGAIEFARDYEIEPHKDFALTSMILEKDDDHIPLMEIPLGRNDKPVLLWHEDDPRNGYYLGQLRKSAGEGNFSILYESMGFDEDVEDFVDDGTEGFEDWDEEEWLVFLQDVDLEELNPFCGIHPFIFDRVIYRCEAERRELQNLELADDQSLMMEPTKEDLRLFDSEYADMSARVYNHDPDPENKGWDEVIAELKEAIEKRPDLARLYDLLVMAHICRKEPLLALNANDKCRKLFPDHLLGKIIRGKLMMDLDREEEVPGIFKGKTLQEERPDLDFTFAEYIGFNNLMSAYYLKKEDLVMAYHYFAMNMNFDQADEKSLDENHSVMLQINIIGKANILIEEARQDEKKMEEVIGLLMDKS